VNLPRVSYIVGSVPRTGSTLLCELLGRTGLAGAPGEFFSPYTVRVQRESLGLDTVEQYVEEVFRLHTGPNGVFGAKMHWIHYETLFGKGDPRELMPNLHFVSITRSDRLRQAISWSRAQQSGKFHAHDPAKSEPAYDAGHITHMLRRIEREEKLWDRTFGRLGIEPHRIVYEDVVAAPEDTVREVLAFLGVEAPADLDIGPPALARQADQVSLEWAERYRGDTATSRAPAPGGA
jgi:LPS sulfotransferase NodH